MTLLMQAIDPDAWGWERDSAGQRWLIETKGMESAEVSQKDAAASNWCENASSLTEIAWRYVKVPQKGFEVLQPRRLADLAALYPLLK